ncbi:MAG: TldD/PmbA family protein [bacterium]|nr:TldD/PmbA family protein [bacterium]
MEKKLKQALTVATTEYIEIRVQRTSYTEVVYMGKELENIGESDVFGGNVRAFHNGGWGFVSFNSLDNLEHHVRLACHQAKLIGNQTSKLAPVKPQKAFISAQPKLDPRSIPLSEKQFLCERYNRQLLHYPQIQSTRILYADGYTRKYYFNSEQTEIEQEKLFAGMSISALAKDGNTVQRAYESLASETGYDSILGLEPMVEQIAERAIGLLSAKRVTSGVYTVVIDQKLAGVFIHEAFGHLSEADHIYDNPRMLAIMRIGTQFGVPELNVVDDATIPGIRGHYEFDDEGVPGQKNYLIKNGILVGRLHSRETAAKMNEPVSGNARAISYRFPPIVRMSCTYIEPSTYSFDKMISEVDYGLYVKGALGGNTNLEMFTFSSEEAYEIKQGKIGQRIRDVILSGNVFETLQNIDAIGNDLEIRGGLGGCGKQGQSPLPVSDGGPHIRIRNVVIGGI